MMHACIGFVDKPACFSYKIHGILVKFTVGRAEGFSPLPK
jgi:hypothetical protein